ncbi:nitroreductase family protein [Cupriavidus pauculus]|uniref:nitroreductase family protein n=1 Tax=Cupriavidus pauculus TaxID=82633 RepID=UPI0034E44EAD
MLNRQKAEKANPISLPRVPITASTRSGVGSAALHSTRPSASHAALGVYGAADCGAYIANSMLAARSLGVASIVQAALALHADFIRGDFGLPADRMIICSISFGYEDPNHPANSFRTSRSDWRNEVTLLSQ